MNAIHKKLHGEKSPYADVWEPEEEPEVTPYKPEPLEEPTN